VRKSRRAAWKKNSFLFPLFLTSALPIFACPELKAGTRYKRIPMS
jgi:hypothetical protein